MGLKVPSYVCRPNLENFFKVGTIRYIKEFKHREKSKLSGRDNKSYLMQRRVNFA